MLQRVTGVPVMVVATAQNAPVVDLLGAGPRTVTVDLARERVAAVVDLARAKSPEPPAVETPRQVPVVPPLRLPAVEDDDAPSVEVPPPKEAKPRPLVVRPKEAVAKAPLIVKRVRMQPSAAKKAAPVAIAPPTRPRKSRKRRTAAAQLLRQLNDVEDTLTRAEASATFEPHPPKVPAYRLAWRESQAYLAAGDGEAAVAAVLAANHDRTTARLLVALGDAQLSNETLDALLSEVASLLGGDYRAYALPYVAAAAKAGALNRVPATTRAELAAGLAHAAARGDGNAGYASKLLGRVGLLAT